MMSGGIDVCFDALLELETTLLKSSDDVSLGPERDHDVVRKIRREKEDGAEWVRPRRFVSENRRTHMPASARGLVSSSTRFPASRPSPSTDITTKSSEEMVAPYAPVAELLVALEGPAKRSFAKDFGHTIEHSIGVMEMFKNGY